MQETDKAIFRLKDYLEEQENERRAKQGTGHVRRKSNKSAGRMPSTPSSSKSG